MLKRIAAQYGEPEKRRWSSASSGRLDEDNFTSAPLTPELGEASFVGETPGAAESPAKPRFSRLACSLLLLS
jgi:hypothetical protein